jgi:tetratricopeptide (TPR) repeat protein
MLTDAQGLAVTTDSPETLAAINGFIEQSLSYGKDAERLILQGIAADPDCAIAQAYAAAYYLSLESATAKRQAMLHLQIARQSLTQATERERLYVEAIDAWAATRVERAIALHELIAERFPHDLISVQQGQYHYFYWGESERLLRIAEKVLPANWENHYLYGMIAFGLEQCHRLSQAEAIGRLATAMNRQNPWAHHAIAHVMETQGRIEEGIAWMESLADTWENCNTLLYTHNWWHIALYYLKRGDWDKVLTLYDTHIWGRACKDSAKDQVGAISLLLRLELIGIEVGTRWQALTPYLLSRIHEHLLPFQDLHYVYALARAGQTGWANEMLLSMQEYALTANLHQRQTWLEVAIPAARGMVAHAQRDWSTAVTQLQAILSRLPMIGGSHTQRQLFNQVYHDACLHSQPSWLSRNAEGNLDMAEIYRLDQAIHVA